MRTFICGIHPRGKAHEIRVFKPGDQLLKMRKKEVEIQTKTGIHENNYLWYSSKRQGK